VFKRRERIEIIFGKIPTRRVSTVILIFARVFCIQTTRIEGRFYFRLYESFYRLMGEQFVYIIIGDRKIIRQIRITRISYLHSGENKKFKRFILSSYRFRYVQFIRDCNHFTFVYRFSSTVVTKIRGKSVRRMFGAFRIFVFLFSIISLSRF